MIVGNLATYPARRKKIAKVIKKLCKQLDLLNVVFNEYDEVPAFLSGIANINPIIPDVDYKDVGKFICDAHNNDDYVFLFDDDIEYPNDYCNSMIALYEKIPLKRKVIGLHGTIYSDFYDGNIDSKYVFHFRRKLEKYRVVNQLGTGTVLCKGSEMPPKEFMRSSEKFVDVRFAVYQNKHEVPLICVPRSKNWLKSYKFRGVNTIYEEFTKKQPKYVEDEILKICGFSKLNNELLSGLKSYC